MSPSSTRPPPLSTRPPPSTRALDAPDLEFSVEELALGSADVAHLHELLVARLGGAGGVRDRGALEQVVELAVEPSPASQAAGAPPSSQGPRSGPVDVFSTAAGYAHQICRLRPFHASNAGTALLVALVFLQLAGVSVRDPNRLLSQAMVELAGRGIDRAAFAALLRRLARE